MADPRRLPLPADSRLRNAAALRDASAPEVSAADLLARGFAAEARFMCETLRLFRLCPRSACRKTRRCGGMARLCLETHGAAAPAEAAHGEALLAFEGWIAGLEARRG